MAVNRDDKFLGDDDEAQALIRALGGGSPGTRKGLVSALPRTEQPRFAAPADSLADPANQALK